MTDHHYSPRIATVADDRELVSAAQAGDRAAMDALLRRHYDRIFALCRRVTGSDADGADAAQEALIAIVRGLPRFDGHARFSTWVYRVATNVCLDELRRQRRRPVPGLGDADEAAAADPIDDVPLLEDRVGDRMDIDAALATLPPDFRAAVVLRDVCSSTTPRSARCSASHPERFAHGSPRQGGGGRCARRELRSPDPSSYRVAMSDQSLSRDELASALLDAEVAGPSSVDPALAAHVEEFRRAADAIGAPVPIDDVVRERAIEAALAEFDAPATSDPADAAPKWAPSRPQRPCPAGLVGFLPSRVPRPRLSSSSAPSPCCNATTRARPTPRRSRSRHPLPGRASLRRRRAGLAASSADAAGEAAAPPNAPLPAKRDLGEISGDDQLRAALAPEQFTSTAANAGPDPCEAAVRATVVGELGELAGSVTLRFEEQPARALVFIDADGTDHIVVVADQTCEVLDQVD